MTIVACEPVASFLNAASIRAMSPTLLFDAEKPARPREVYQLSAGLGWRHAYTYIFLRDDWPIYVGMSVNPGARFEKHGRRDWFPVANRFVLLLLEAETRHEARLMALFVEAKAIRLLGPSHNVAGVR